MHLSPRLALIPDSDLKSSKQENCHFVALFDSGSVLNIAGRSGTTISSNSNLFRRSNNCGKLLAPHAAWNHCMTAHGSSLFDRAVKRYTRFISDKAAAQGVSLTTGCHQINQDTQDYNFKMKLVTFVSKHSHSLIDQEGERRQVLLFHDQEKSAVVAQTSRVEPGWQHIWILFLGTW